MVTQERGRRLAIIGAGHAHSELIRRLRPLTKAGVEATVIAPEDFWYSGLATGMLGGRFDVELDRIDVAKLCRGVGARLLRDRVESIDPNARVIHLSSGNSLLYDLAALDVGSRVPVERVEGLAEFAFATKPIRRLAELRADLARRFRGRNGNDGPIRVLVIGGGATACEITANIRALADRFAAPISITMVSARDRLLPTFPEPASRSLTEALVRRGGITIRTGSSVRRLAISEATLDNGDRLGFDVAVAAIGLVAPVLIGRIGLPTARDGRLLIDDSLRSVAANSLFASGDCATLAGTDLPRIGVIAVRQAAVLAHNLRASFLGRPLRRFRHRRHYLQILNLGDETGLASFGPFWLQGRAMLYWKDALDRTFIRRFA